MFTVVYGQNIFLPMRPVEALEVPDVNKDGVISEQGVLKPDPNVRSRERRKPTLVKC